jgi:hypothetical protein
MWSSSRSERDPPSTLQGDGNDERFRRTCVVYMDEMTVQQTRGDSLSAIPYRAQASVHARDADCPIAPIGCEREDKSFSQI